MIVLKGLASLPAKRFRSLAAVAWKTLHAFADHRKSASGNSTACRGKPRIHADPPTPGSAAPAPAGRAPNGDGSKTRFVIPKTEPAAKTRPQRCRCGQALNTPAAPLPASVRNPREYSRTARRQDATGTSRGKVCLKSNTSRHRPLRGSRPHGRQDHHLHAGAEPGSAGHLQHPGQDAGANAPRQEHRKSRAGPTPTEQLQPSGSGSRHARPAARAPGTALRLCRLAWFPPTALNG